MRTFFLWTFQIIGTNTLVVTRSETQEQAKEYAGRDKRVSCLDSCPIIAGKSYGLNHAPGWLHRRPYWLKIKEKKALRY